VHFTCYLAPVLNFEDYRLSGRSNWTRLFEGHKNNFDSKGINQPQVINNKETSVIKVTHITEKDHLPGRLKLAAFNLVRCT
jgi:hypothetical protein